MATGRLPVHFLPHGGGPWPFVDMGGMLAPAEIASLREHLEALPNGLGQRPRAILVVSAHFERNLPTVTTAAHPPLYFDYGGFPPESYRLRWPAPGSPELASRVGALLGAAGIETAEDSQRGLDHGTFIPLMLAWPGAEIPVVQLSLRKGLDPAFHLAMGRALAPLRDEGVLILGSGMTFHDLRAIGTQRAYRDSEVFDSWLQDTMAAPPQERDRRLLAWESAPSAKAAHPRPEHLIPLLVAAGAAADDPSTPGYHAVWGGVWTAGFRFG